MIAADVAWYARRLRAMTPQEILWRAEDAVGQRTWAREQVREGFPPGRPPGTLVEPAFEATLPVDARKRVTAEAARATVDAADRILAGEWDVLGVRRTDIAAPDWFLDQVTGRRAPSSDFAFRINHRDEASVGNIKSLWEVSRHHHLTVLAAAWWLTEEEHYATAVDQQLRSWWQQNLFLSGVHWTSGIEIGIRLISWTWIRRLLNTWHGASDLFEHNDEAIWQLWWHQRYLARFRSRGSSANNHVIAEAAGLVVASNAFPWFPESAAWRRDAGSLLEGELESNTFPSGVNREMASEYHGFVTELALVAAVEAAAAGSPLSSATWSGLGHALDAAAALVDVRGRPPRQGDGDDGRVLVVDAPEHPTTWLPLIGVGAGLLGAADWWPEPRASVEGAVLSAMVAEPVAVHHREARPDRFGDAGIVLLRTPAGARPEIWCRCDGGPHGFLSIAAHAHADALSLEVRHNGVDILADPGTYCYHGESEWRSYFRSTIGHNTLEVGGVDQSESGGPFLWTRHARTRTSAVERNGRVQSWSAEHDGYSRGSAHVVHRRTVTLDGEEATLHVQDEVVSDAAVDARLAWHLGPAVEVRLSGGHALLSWDDSGRTRRATLTLPEVLHWTSHRGQSDPVMGWYSPGFGSKVPATTLLGQGRVDRVGCLSTRVAFLTD